ncbi:MAG: histidine phosphatase family protein [Kiloniellaceae bacterium]
MRFLGVLAGGLLLALGMAPSALAAGDFDLATLKNGGYVVLLRHVKAGGVDADDFDLENCATQRQVGAAGRTQAEILAERFRRAGIAQARVLTSQWCRARQTAELLGLGPVTEETGLNYFHWKLGGEAEMNQRLRQFFAELEAPAAGSPLVLVSHKTAFAAIGQKPPPSGGGLVLVPNGSAAPDVVGVITAPE